MKKCVVFVCMAIVFVLATPIRARCQADEIAQLLLNVEKLAQLKSILDNMYKGYTILTKGYNTIKNISEGNFSMHDLFLKGLLAVNPSIAKYQRVSDIVSMQLRMVKEYKGSLKDFSKSSLFSPSELEYFGRVYGRLIDRSLDNLDELLMYVTSDKLRMSDDERLAGIDRIYYDMQDKLNFLLSFNNSGQSLLVLRIKERGSLDLLNRLHDLN